MNAIKRSDLKREKNMSCTHVLDVVVYATLSFSFTRSLLTCMYASVGAVSRYEVFVLLRARTRTHNHISFKFNVYDPGLFAGKSPFLPVIFSFCSSNDCCC